MRQNCSASSVAKSLIPFPALNSSFHQSLDAIRDSDPLSGFPLAALVAENNRKNNIAKGAAAIVPAEVGMPTNAFRLKFVDEVVVFIRLAFVTKVLLSS